MSLINREALYEKACDLEAQALAYVGKIVNDETKIEEWRIWSVVLAERTAFKHDVFDAPEVQPEQRWIPCSERLPDRPEQMLVYAMNTHFSIAKYKEVRKGVNDYVYTWVTDNAFDIPHEVKNVIAWLPLPEPYREEGD